MEHIPILPIEIADVLLVDAHGTYVDCTFGRGGHARVLLARMAADGRLVAIDRDPEAMAAAHELAATDDRVRVVAGRFGDLAELLGAIDVSEAAGVLMDLGVSSPQLDDPHRGFSFRFDAPLDMRMDPTQGQSAAQWLASADADELERVFRELGEERYARRIAAAVVQQRARAPIATTGALAELVEAAQPRRDPHKHAATRVFQAIRMQVNDELGELERGLAQAFELLAPGGRLAVLSFHSIEDRIVKRRFRDWIQGEPMPRRLPVTGAARGRARSVIRSRAPAADEVRGNPRARSARLRVVEKVA